MSKRRNARETRQRILDAAESHFAQDGFSGARIDAIAADSTYNKSLIFQYFGDKAGLYRAVIRRQRTQAAPELLALVRTFSAHEPDTMLARQFFGQFIRWHFAFFQTHANYRRILAWEAAEGWTTYNTVDMTEEESELHDAVGRWLRRAQAAGVLRPDFNPEFLLFNVTNLCLNLLASFPRLPGFQGRDRSLPDALRLAQEQILTLVLDGVMCEA
jgi:AcrR family transcriptional regulator